MDSTARHDCMRTRNRATSVPYDRGLRVRGSPHPFFERDYEPFLLQPAAESDAFRIQSGFGWPDARSASLIWFGPLCRIDGRVGRGVGFVIG